MDAERPFGIQFGEMLCASANGALGGRTFCVHHFSRGAIKSAACGRWDSGNGDQKVLVHIHPTWRASDTGLVNTGDRVRLYDPEPAAVARSVEWAPAAVEIRVLRPI
jgi:hypothetical protein